MTKYRPRTKPFNHQRRALIWLWKNGNGGLFFEPGTGKTKVAIDFSAALYLQGESQRVLVLSPINALGVWEDQVALHLPEQIERQMEVLEGSIAEKTARIQKMVSNGSSSLQMVVVNYDAIIRRDQEWAIMDVLSAFDADILILDESHYVKNATAKRSLAAHKLGTKARHVLLLTGTPIGNKYLDLYSQLKVIDPMIWRDPYKGDAMSWTRFRYMYGVWGGRTGYELRGYQNLDDLRARYKPYVMTVRKRACLDLPKETDVNIPVKMSQHAWEVYSIFSETGYVVHRTHEIEAPIVLTKLLRLRQMTGGWVHDTSGQILELHRDKLNVLGSLLADLESAERKVLVFAAFVAEMEAICELARTDLLIRGGVSDARRRSVVREFQRTLRSQVLVLHAGSAEALDGLQSVCSDAIFFSKDHSWIKYQQSRGRLVRSGQEDPVTFYHLTVKGSVDNLVDQALREKKNLERMVMDDPDLMIAPQTSEY